MSEGWGDVECSHHVSWETDSGKPGMMRYCFSMQLAENHSLGKQVGKETSKDCTGYPELPSVLSE